MILTSRVKNRVMANKTTKAMISNSKAKINMASRTRTAMDWSNRTSMTQASRASASKINKTL